MAVEMLGFRGWSLNEKTKELQKDRNHATLPTAHVSYLGHEMLLFPIAGEFDADVGKIRSDFNSSTHTFLE